MIMMIVIMIIMIRLFEHSNDEVYDYEDEDATQYDGGMECFFWRVPGGDLNQIQASYSLIRPSSGFDLIKG